MAAVAAVARAGKRIAFAMHASRFVQGATKSRRN